MTDEILTPMLVSAIDELRALVADENYAEASKIAGGLTTSLGMAMIVQQLGRKVQEKENLNGHS